MIKKIKNWLKNRKALSHIDDISDQDIIKAQEFLKWLFSDQPSTYFRLNEK